MAKNNTPANTGTNAAPAAQNEDVKGINHLFFNEVKNGETVMICGELKSIGTKETPYGEVPVYKGDFIVKAPNGQLLRSGTAYLPPDLGEALRTEAKKVEKWSLLQFKFNTTKSDNKFSSVTWIIRPRLLPEQDDRVAALVNATK